MLVLFAVFMAIVVGLCSFALDVGNWFEHQRHLQLQADAAAFAGASEIEFPCTSAVAENIYKAAAQYAGAANVVTPNGTFATGVALNELHNTQVNEEAGKNQEHVHAEVNLKSFYKQEKPDTKTVEKSPCESNEIDVKMTETNLPELFKFIGIEPEATAQARIKIVKEEYATDVEPLIESEPVEARVFYVNDNPDGTDSNYGQETLATGLLTDAGSNEEKGTIKWTDAKTPVALKVADAHIGVRIALAGKAGALTGAGNETDSVCTHVYVECFDEDSGVVPPLINISGYSEEGTGKAEPTFAPVRHKVTLSTVTKAEAKGEQPCTDAYFTSAVTNEKAATCVVGISAAINWGNTNIEGLTVTSETVDTEGFTNGVQKGPEEPLTTYEAATGTWKGLVKLHNWYYGNFGSTEINLSVKCKPATGDACAGAAKEETVKFEDVQRAYTSGPDGSNRIVAAKVYEPAVSEADTDAFEVCETHDKSECTHSLAVTIELKGSLEDAKKFLNKEAQEIPAFHIVFGDNDQENDDQFAVTCPPTTSATELIAKFETALAHGCEGTYRVNVRGGSCTEEKTERTKIEKEETEEKKGRETEEKAKTEREAKEKPEREKWVTEEGQGKITAKERTEKEATQATTKKTDETKEATEKKTWEEEEKHLKAPFITKAERETKEGTQKTARVKREAEEAENLARWEKEEKETKVSKAERETKEAAQKTTREKDETEEQTKRTKRDEEEKATKKKREELGLAAPECIGLVSTAGSFPTKGEPIEEVELSALFQNYFAKRIERPVNGLKYECPNAWAKQLLRAEKKKLSTIPLPPILATDSRVMQFFVVPFTVTDFERKGEISPLVPIEKFATFYVTGWGRGNTEAGQLPRPDEHTAFNPKERRDECSEELFQIPEGATESPAGLAESEEAAEEKGKSYKESQQWLEREEIPLKEREAEEKKLGFDDDVEQPREIVGHLIKYVKVLGEKAGSTACVPEQLETCEAVLAE